MIIAKTKEQMWDLMQGMSDLKPLYDCLVDLHLQLDQKLEVWQSFNQCPIDTGGEVWLWGAGQKWQKSGHMGCSCAYGYMFERIIRKLGEPYHLALGLEKQVDDVMRIHILGMNDQNEGFSMWGGSYYEHFTQQTSQWMPPIYWTFLRNRFDVTVSTKGK